MRAVLEWGERGVGAASGAVGCVPVEVNVHKARKGIRSGLLGECTDAVCTVARAPSQVLGSGQGESGKRRPPAAARVVAVKWRVLAVRGHGEGHVPSSPSHPRQDSMLPDRTLAPRDAWRRRPARARSRAAWLTAYTAIQALKCSMTLGGLYGPGAGRPTPADTNLRAREVPRALRPSRRAVPGVAIGAQQDTSKPAAAWLRPA